MMPKSRHFRFDCVFAPEASQIEVFSRSGVEYYCDAALEGYSATIICFGQTGSGKTYTMMGPTDIDNESAVAVANPQAPDMVPRLGLEYRAAYYICSQIQQANAASAGSVHYVLKASFTEIYNESVNDLLQDKNNLKVRWAQNAQAFFIEQLMIVTCDSVDDVLAVLAEGNANRKRASHRLNQDSSRSHVIFTLYIEKRVVASGGQAPPPTMGKINFVDLAGSERLRDTGSTGVNAEETKSINKSLFALGNVISCLASRHENVFVPYRDSSLTKLLMDSLGGGCRTLMVACVTPAAIHIDNTISTLKYATRTKNIVNSMPRVRTDPKRQQLFELQTEVELLRAENAQLKAKINQLLAEGGKGRTPSPGPMSSGASALSAPSAAPSAIPMNEQLRRQTSGMPLSLMPQQQQAQPSFGYPGQPPPSSNSAFSVTSTRSNQRMLGGTPPLNPTQPMVQLPPVKHHTPPPILSPSALEHAQAFRGPLAPQEPGPPQQPQQPAWEAPQPRTEPENPQLRGEVEQLRALISQAEESLSPVRRRGSGLSSFAKNPVGTANPLAPEEGQAVDTTAFASFNRNRQRHQEGRPASLLDRPQFQSFWEKAAVPAPEPQKEAIADSAGFRPPSPNPLDEYGFRPARRRQPQRLSLHLPSMAALSEEDALEGATAASSVVSAPAPRDAGAEAYPYSVASSAVGSASSSPTPIRGRNIEQEVLEMRQELSYAQQEIRRMQQRQQKELSRGSSRRDPPQPSRQMKFT